MQRVFGGRLSGLYRWLPGIVAELAKDVSVTENGKTVHHDRGTRCYFLLRGEKPVEQDTAEVFVRTKIGMWKLREFPWDHFRFPEITNVPSNIGERCLQVPTQQLEQMLQQITLKVPAQIRGQFDVPIDDLK